MAYNAKIVCAVKVGGKILREKKDDDGNTFVTLPFGAEYSLLLKNLSGQNALVNIEIDGKKVSSNGFVLKANEEFDIERFANEARKFKFINKTQEISDFRGDKIDDGFVRITWQFEVPKTEIIKTEIIKIHYDYQAPCFCSYCRCSPCICQRPYIAYPRYHYSYHSSWSDESICNTGHIECSTSSASQMIGSGNVASSTYDVNCIYAYSQTSDNLLRSSETKKSHQSDAGITVAGSKSEQKFVDAHIGELQSNIHSMIIRLRGTDKEQVKVKKPMTVDKKRQCPTCGRWWKGQYEFCGRCGTALKD